MSGCPGSKTIDFSEKTNQEGSETGKRPSQLRQWPIQMHLVSPQAPYFHGKDVLLAADCSAFALGDFHKDYLKGKSIGIACPKLDSDQEVYIEKIKSLIDNANDQYLDRYDHASSLLFWIGTTCKGRRRKSLPQDTNQAGRCWT